ncbi:hypothetical protein WN944_025572 [Citrus x changshan-huyou]|uniref:Uncharacterized protein n=1 Tax=Citrus x changshan-huyou TaxID=2935761 RepID=A0AAP0LSS1_9ROSI
MEQLLATGMAPPLVDGGVQPLLTFPHPTGDLSLARQPPSQPHARSNPSLFHGFLPSNNLAATVASLDATSTFSLPQPPPLTNPDTDQPSMTSLLLQNTYHSLIAQFLATASGVMTIITISHQPPLHHYDTSQLPSLPTLPPPQPPSSITVQTTASTPSNLFSFDEANFIVSRLTDTTFHIQSEQPDCLKEGQPNNESNYEQPMKEATSQVEEESADEEQYASTRVRRAPGWFKDYVV